VNSENISAQIRCLVT